MLSLCRGLGNLLSSGLASYLGLELGLPLDVLVDRRADGLLGKHGAVELDGGEVELAGNVLVGQLHGLRKGLAADGFGGEGGGRDGAPTAKSLELGVLNYERIRVDLQADLHHVSALRGPHHSSYHVLVVLVKLANVAGVLVVVKHLVAVLGTNDVEREQRGEGRLDSDGGDATHALLDLSEFYRWKGITGKDCPTVERLPANLLR